MEGIPGIKPSAGPLAHTLDDIELFMDTVLKAEPWKYDVTASAAPWEKLQLHESSSHGKLTIGVLPESKDFPLHPPIQRVLQSAITALSQRGHRIVQLPDDPSRDLAYASRLAFQYFTYGPHIDHVAASGEPLVPSVAKMSSPMFTGPLPVDMDLPVFKKISALHTARQGYADAWRRCWVENGLDVVLAPGAQNTAVPHDTFGWPPYTVVWNLLDVSIAYSEQVYVQLGCANYDIVQYPACIIPYGKASKQLDPAPMVIDDGVQPSCEYHLNLSNLFH